MSTTKEKKVHVARGFSRLTTEQLMTAGTAAANDMDGNPKVSNPPVSIADFKAGLQVLITASAAAQDGGKKAIAERNKQGAAFLKMMNKQAMYVDEVAGTDPTVITNAGFQVMTGPTPAQPLQQPTIDKIVQKNSGQQQVSATAVLGARMFQIRYGAVGAGGTAPASWTIVELPSARPSPVISGLIPGTTYSFQVRAFGKLGWTDWSEPINKMSI